MAHALKSSSPHMNLRVLAKKISINLLSFSLTLCNICYVYTYSILVLFNLSASYGVRKKRGH